MCIVYVHFLSWLFYCVFCVFCVFIVLSVHFLSSSCLLFVSSGFCIWASLPEIKRWNGMEWNSCLSLPRANPLTTGCLVVTVGCSIGECGSLSFECASAHYNMDLLTYLNCKSLTGPAPFNLFLLTLDSRQLDSLRKLIWNTIRWKLYRKSCRMHKRTVVLKVHKLQKTLMLTSM